MKTLTISITVILLVSACSQECGKKPARTPLNPNGDSELALLMRDMFDESDSLKARVVAGQPLSGLRKYKEIHSAIPTDTTVRGPVFDSFAHAYIQSLRTLEAADSNRVFRFNEMVDQCMSCHTEFCPGPRKRIRQLYINQ